jgi:NAD(P)-dependent dehydrogenase (short-subunit alcohol dehydrogenase family)
MTCAVITGASSGLGACIYSGLLDHYAKVIGWSLPEVDVTDESSLFVATQRWPEDMRVNVVVNCAGISKLSWLADANWLRTWQCMDTNALGLALVTKALLPRLKGGTILNIISEAAHKPMRASAAYCASKAAAEMLTLQIARELWDDYRITVFGISPARLKGTPMTLSVNRQVAEVRGWSELGVQEASTQAMAIGEEIDPQVLANFICYLLSKKEHHRYLHGCIIPYGASK